MTPEQLAALPAELHILGAIESGDIWLNDVWLDPMLSEQLLDANAVGDGFNWGKLYHKPDQLSLAILIEFMPIGEALNLYKDFRYRVISELPQTNFDIVINLRQEIEEIIKLKIIK